MDSYIVSRILKLCGINFRHYGVLYVARVACASKFFLCVCGVFFFFNEIHHFSQDMKASIAIYTCINA